MNSIPIERSVDVIYARTKLEAALTSYGVNWEVQVTGQYVKTAKCMLYDKSGNYLDFGYGKGDLESSTTGAMFEAAEHWFCQFSNCNKGNVSYRDTQSFIKESHISGCFPISIIADSPKGIMPFREYKQMGKNTTILYPLALSTPRYIDEKYEYRSSASQDNFNYSKIERYCTNSGVAIGSNELEATIHGILEAVERDSFSTFLVDAFLNRNKKSLRLIDLSSLPNELVSLVEDVEREVDHKILIFELANKYGIPVFCSALHKSNFPIEITGYGCSLSREHAASRSLHELVQCYHATTWFHPEDTEGKDNSILLKFENHSFHLRCAKLKLAEWCEEIGFSEINFFSTANIKHSVDLKQYLLDLTNAIERTGCHAYSSVVNELVGGQVITHSFIEGQDHFFCVTEGCFVLPNQIKINSEIYV
ncbi:YcaO-like family protein [Pseudomonas sp. R1-1]|uniref:YcaO-like family protein n=1 Tax=Pseudomonas sp. R1-1 TaxID=1602529 RepID=UPI003DA9AB07